jgi:hypothetical protein
MRAPRGYFTVDVRRSAAAAEWVDGLGLQLARNAFSGEFKVVDVVGGALCRQFPNVVQPDDTLIALRNVAGGVADVSLRVTGMRAVDVRDALSSRAAVDAVGTLLQLTFMRQLDSCKQLPQWRPPAAPASPHRDHAAARADAEEALVEDAAERKHTSSPSAADGAASSNGEAESAASPAPPAPSSEPTWSSRAADAAVHFAEMALSSGAAASLVDIRSPEPSPLPPPPPPPPTLSSGGPVPLAVGEMYFQPEVEMTPPRGVAIATLAALSAATASARREPSPHRIALHRASMHAAKRQLVAARAALAPTEARYVFFYVPLHFTRNMLTI